MAPPETLRRSVDADGVGRLTLSRPNVLNALSTRMLEEIADAVTWLDEQGVAVVVVSGQGRAFSAGFDRREMASPGFDPATAMRAGAAMADAIETAAAVTVAAVHGHCVGGGLVLATACDLRLAADDARFAIPEVDLGIPLGWGGIPLLVREIGPTRTRELVMTCRPFDAAEARDMRLLTTVVPGDRLDAAAVELARTIAAKPRAAIRATKDQVRRAARSAVAADDGTHEALAVIAEANGDRPA